MKENELKTISNEEKAKEIAHDYFRRGQLGLVAIDTESAGYDCAMQAMELKDKQHTKEKQLWIDKLEDWLANNICNAYNFRGDNISATFMNDCIKAMKG